MLEFIGLRDFAHCWSEGSWLVFSNMPPGTASGVESCRHWYGTCLGMVGAVYRKGYKVTSTRVLGSTGWLGFQTGAAGLGRGLALDTVELCTREMQDSANGLQWPGHVSDWTCPVVMCVFRGGLLLQENVGTSAVCRQLIRAECGTVIPVCGWRCEVHVHAPTFSRFQDVKERWRELTAGTAVVCQRMLGSPATLFSSRSSIRSTCGSCVPVPSSEFDTWTLVPLSARWICPSCQRALASGSPRCESNVSLGPYRIFCADGGLNARILMQAWAYELTGSADFAHIWREGPWWVFSTSGRGTRPPAGHSVHWHGTCLSQARNIYEEGYKVSHRTCNKCTGWFGFEDGDGHVGRGHAMDRAQLWRGWLERPDGLEPGRDGFGTWTEERRNFWLTAWSCPVSVRVFRPVKLLHDWVGRPPTRKQVVRGCPRVTLPVRDYSHGSFEIHVHGPTYGRFQLIQGKWRDLSEGISVMCRTLRGQPEELLTCQSVVTNSCGACVDVASPEFKTWTCATETGRYTCPSCSGALAGCAPRCASNLNWPG